MYITTEQHNLHCLKSGIHSISIYSTLYAHDIVFVCAQHKGSIRPCIFPCGVEECYIMFGFI